MLECFFFMKNNYAEKSLAYVYFLYMFELKPYWCANVLRYCKKIVYKIRFDQSILPTFPTNLNLLYLTQVAHNVNVLKAIKIIKTENILPNL